jgi:hypothetical protein
MPRREAPRPIEGFFYMTNAMTPSTRLVDIAGEQYRLRFNFGFARLAEQELGVSITKAFTADAPAMNTISAVWWAALQADHPMTRSASDELIDAAGLEPVTQWVIEGIGQYFGGGKSGEPGKAKAKRAPKPR